MEKLENDFVTFWMEDGILFNKFPNPIDMNLQRSKAVIEMRHQISNGQKQYWCFDMFNVKEFPKECRDYADVHGQDYLYATAAIVHSHTTKFFVNIFLKIKAPHIPFKAFNDIDSAVKWLKEQKAINDSKEIK